MIKAKSQARIAITLLLPLLLGACVSQAERERAIKEKGDDFGSVPSYSEYTHNISEHIKQNDDVPVPELFKPQYSTPMKAIEFNGNDIEYRGWAIEVAIPTKSLTTIHFMLNDNDYTLIYVRYENGKVLSSSLTDAQGTIYNTKETYAYAKHGSLVLDSNGNIAKLLDYGAIIDSHQKFKYFRNIEYDLAHKINNEHTTNNYQNIEELKRLYDDGVLTDSEFTAAKKKALGI